MDLVFWILEAAKKQMHILLPLQQNVFPSMGHLSLG